MSTQSKMGLAQAFASQAELINLDVSCSGKDNLSHDGHKGATKTTMTPDGKWRIMVVDDDQPLLKVLVGALQSEYEVVGATSGLEALEKIERAEPDLVILDVAMPGIDGVDACRAIRRNARFRDLPVIFLSGLDESTYMDRAKNLGVIRFLRKPVEPVELLVCCREVIERLVSNCPPTKSYTLSELETIFLDGEPIKPVPTTPQRFKQSQSTAEIPKKKKKSPNVAKSNDRPKAKPEDAAFSKFGRRSLRIMAVDDDLEVMDRILAVLRGRAEVFGVSNPVSAMDKIIRYQPDLIILDASIGRLSGYQLSQLLRLNRNMRTIKILFMMSKDCPRETEYVRKLGAANHIVKPFSGKELLEKVAAIIEMPDFIVREKAVSFNELRNEQKEDSSHSILF